MDEKRFRDPESQDMPTPVRSRRFRLIFVILAFFFIGYNVSRDWTTPLMTSCERLYGSRFGAPKEEETTIPEPKTKELVPLEAHIISKCPDTRDALRQLILPVMQQVYDKVDFRLTYIGTPTANDGVKCLHGPSECLGNIIELCARELYPDPKISLGFVMCLTKDYKHIPERSLVEDCALEHAIDFTALNECAARDDGAHGLDLLRKSVQRSADADVSTSCTLRLNDEVYCVRDGGEWKDCPHGAGVNDLVIAVEKLYRKKNSSS